MEFYKKNQTIIFRFVGGVMFIIAFVIFFWTTPKEGISENEKAARNVARMEARIAGASSSASKTSKRSKSPIMKSYKDTQAKQLRYALIVTMIIGAGFLGYSFVRKKED